MVLQQTKNTHTKFRNSYLLAHRTVCFNLKNEFETWMHKSKPLLTEIFMIIIHTRKSSQPYTNHFDSLLVLSFILKDQSDYFILLSRWVYNWYNFVSYEEAHNKN